MRNLIEPQHPKTAINTWGMPLRVSLYAFYAVIKNPTKCWDRL